jgi:hypothetical protein
VSDAGAFDDPMQDTRAVVAFDADGDGAGYVALAFNNATNPAMGVGSGTPISVSITA